jgi:hypothetical protein
VDFKALVTKAQKEGWASEYGNMDTIRQEAASLGWTEVAPRRGEATVSVLRPIKASAAHPYSLSAVYGLGPQPLHTDGAHLPMPPDYVVLTSQSPSATATLLWHAPMAMRSQHSAALRHGMFLVRNGRESFYSPVFFNLRYRYDPACMTACDSRARVIEQYFKNQLVRAFKHEWTNAGQILVIDNRYTLHARCSVADDDLNRCLNRVAFYERASP